ncbi:MAG TPA: DUF2092 domain-containing protein [Candidatus Acidoferrum sp.]|nr:DUF2092 domain-containing protein [Candidatus Acidoferrum sp.]
MRYARIAVSSMILVFAGAMSSSAQTVPAPEQPDAMDLLKSLELAYGAINTYSAKVTNTMAMDSSDAQGKMNVESSMTVILDASGKFRIESKGMIGMLMVNDGKTMWMYMPMANSYSKIPLNGDTTYMHLGGAGAMFGGAFTPLQYRSITSGVKEAKILRSEKLRVNDADVDCWVVSLEYEPESGEASAAAEASVRVSDFSRNMTLWVDKSRYLIYQEDSTMRLTMPNTATPTNMKQTSKVESVTVNEPVSPDAFTFTPPAGAKEMDHPENTRLKATQTQKGQQ